MKTFTQMTKAEQIAYRMKMNRTTIVQAITKPNLVIKGSVVGGTRKEVTADNASFLFNTVRGILE